MRELNEILLAATAGIENQYFQLPVAGREDPIYRERVYCYELYHQMRLRWPIGCPYSLSGEVDKGGHPLIRGEGLDAAKPDFLVHEPGDMGGNFAVIEVKPANTNLRGIKKDLARLSAFRKRARYERALLLIYGAHGSERLVENILRMLHDTGSDTEIWLHPAPNIACFPVR